MMKWLVLDTAEPADFKRIAQLRRVPRPDVHLTETVAKILQRVQRGGDRALLQLTQKFDRVTLTPQTLRLSSAAVPPNPAVRQALRHALKNIRAFSQAGVPKNRQLINAEGARLVERYQAFQRVGIYVPGGTAPLVSTALMTVGLAQVAGVPEIVVTTPPPVNAALHYALTLAGATEIFQLGGAQAIGALAYGTGTIRPVQKIFGPGNSFVVEAKRQVFGPVSIDLLPGPSEIAIIADKTARADFIAADLLAQAEHGSSSRILFLTDTPSLLAEVQAAITQQLPELSRQTFLQNVLRKNAVFVLTESVAQAVQLAEDYAPEHLSLFVKNAAVLARKICNAGAVFVGHQSPVAAGDYLAGPSHTLPTGGAGKSFGGLTIDQFFKRVSVIEYDAKSMRRAAPLIACLAELEQLDAHAASARVRVKK